MVGMWSEARYTAGYMGSVAGFFTVGIIMAATLMGGARLDSYDVRNLCITMAGLVHGFANICFLGLSYAMPGQASVVAPLRLVLPAVRRVLLAMHCHALSCFIRAEPTAPSMTCSRL
jgi:hypothetical protein